MAHTAACLAAADPADDDFCATVRGYYDYVSTTIIPEELFVPTLLLNGPFCRQVRRLASSSSEMTGNDQIS